MEVDSTKPKKHTMLNKSTVQLMALGLVGSFAATAAAQDSGALIDALVRKGVLKDQEAEQIRSQLSRDYAANTPAGKLNISSSVKELKLSGDVRLRYQYDEKYSQAGPPSSSVDQRERFRLRLRINADYKLADDFFAGFGLQTEQKNDSGNQTMAGGSGNNSITANSQGTSTSGDYFQNYNIYINKAFIGWNVVPGVTLIGGKQVNPLYTTDLVWDADINPTGFSQRVDLHKFLELGPLELSIVGLQGIVSDNNEKNSYGTTNGTVTSNRDAWVYHTQLIAAVKLSDDVKVTVAPGFYGTNNSVIAGDGGGEENFSKNAAYGTTKGLKVLTAPGDVAFKVAGKPVKFQWDLAWNKDSKVRSGYYAGTTTYTYNVAPTNGAAATTYTSTSSKSVGDVVSITATPAATVSVSGGGDLTATVPTIPNGAVVTSLKSTSLAPSTTFVPSERDALAYLVGFQFGENKKKGDWSLLANYRQVGLSAVDPQINDSDWALSQTNMAGFKVGFFYNIGDATTLGSSFDTADNLRPDLGGNTSYGPGSVNNSVKVLQVDLSVKF